MCSVGEYLYVFGGMTAFIQENPEINFITPCLKSTLNWTKFAFRKLYQTVEPFTAWKPTEIKYLYTEDTIMSFY